MYKKLKYYNKNRKTIGDFAMARIGHHSIPLNKNIEKVDLSGTMFK